MTPDSIGIHALVWTGQWNREKALSTVVATRRLGYDRLEVPLLLDDWRELESDWSPQLLRDHDLKVTGNLFLTRETDISSEDPTRVAAGEKRLTQGVDIVRHLGGDHLCGTVYSMLGKPDGPPTTRGRANCVEVLTKVADRAGGYGITLGLEICNRYETNLVNTTAQAAALVRDINRRNVVVHLDTYHMNIEEPDLFTPVIAHGPALGYVHLGEGHRGFLGSGNVDFGAFVRALVAVDYSGPIVFESFSSAVVAPQLSNALCIWRNLWTDSEALAEHAKTFIDAQLGAAEAARNAGRAGAEMAQCVVVPA